MMVVPRLPVPDVGGTPPEPLTGAGFVRGLPIGALILLPIVWRLVAARNEEFPWSGDHFFHLFASGGYGGTWTRHALFVGLFVAAAVVLRQLRVRPWAILMFGALLVFALRDVAPPGAARYPASAYLVELPLRLLFGRPSLGEPPLTLDRISMAASVPVWLFALRPLVMRRWPDLRMLPFALAFFWQKDIVYWTTQVGLEPWSVMFVLLAVELTLSDLPYRVWLAPLLVGVGATFKEPAILVLPWIALAGLPRLPRTARAWGGYALHCFLAMLPFVVYYKFRAATGVQRKFGLADPATLVSVKRLWRFGHRVAIQFGATGLVLLALTLALVGYAAWRDRAQRWVIACLLCAVACQIAFFYVDQASEPWTGYPRFHLIAFAILVVIAWSSFATRARTLAIAAAVIVALYAQPLIADLALFSQPDPARNYTEAFDAPVFFPIRALVEEAEDSGALAVGDAIAVRERMVAVVGVIYPVLGQRHAFAPYDGVCTCTAGRRALLVLVEYPTGLRSSPGGKAVYPGTAACLATLRSSCARVFERAIDGYPTGALGVGVK
jgi:hypothetical protein